MKKLILLLIVVFVACYTGGQVFADCQVQVTLAVTDDPGAASQEVFYDPDSTTDGDEYIPDGCAGDMTMTKCTFSISAPAKNDFVWVITKNADGTEFFKSPAVAVGGIAGSTVTTVVVQCQ